MSAFQLFDSEYSSTLYMQVHKKYYICIVFFLAFLNDLFELFTNTKTYIFLLFTEMLAQFTDTEELDGEIYHCEKCNGKNIHLSV